MKHMIRVALVVLAIALFWKAASAPVVQAAASSPRIVASVTLTAQTASVSTTTAFTAAKTGLYRVSTLVSTTNFTVTLPNTVCVTGVVSWTDDTGSAQSFGTSQVRAIGTTTLIAMESGQNLTYQLNVPGCSPQPSPFAYNFFLVAEEL